MLIRNIYTSQGLVNGVMGFVENIEVNPETLTPRVIYVKFDDDTVGKILQSAENNNVIPIEPIQSKYLFEGRIIIREQFPLQSCWGCTIHKLQGTTLQHAVVSIGSKVFAKGMSYVAMSRLKSLDGLISELDI